MQRFLLPPFVLALAAAVCLPQKALRPTVYAIRDARAVLAPGKTLEKATLVIRDGVIEDLGSSVKPPPDAVVIDGKGLTLYPGFIDALSTTGYDHAQRKSSGGDPAPEDLASEALAATKPDNRKGMTPEFQVRSALKDDPNAHEWRKLGFTARLIAPDGGIFSGQSALVSLSGAPAREATLRPSVALHAAFRSGLGGGDGYPRSLMGQMAHARQMLVDAGHHARRQAAFEKREGKGKRPPADLALETLAFALAGSLPVVFEADTKSQIERVLDFADEFRLSRGILGGRDAWKVAARLAKGNVPVLHRVDFQEVDGKPAPQRVREERERIRKEEAACAAALLRAGVRVALCTHGLPGDKPWEKFKAAIAEMRKAGLTDDALLASLTLFPANILGAGGQLGTLEKGKAAHVVLSDGAPWEEKSRIRGVFSDGVYFDFSAEAEGKGADRKDKGAKKPEGKEEEPGKGKEKPTKPAGDDRPSYDVEIEADRVPLTRTKGNVLIKGATVHTATGPAQEAADILVIEGKIAAIGKDIRPGNEVTVIDARGMHVMPGIIDTHCHFSIEGGVNESSLSIVPEVRVRDVIDSEDVQIYRALAGGVTTARLLHGSANVIGGQDAVIKLKYGKSASDLLVTDGPRGVKFALGENVKRTDGRFPNTRLGVEAVLVRAFTEAREYAKAWKKWEADGKGDEPRRDLRLEALADVLDGRLKVHCHCYRADEILMLLKVCDRFGVKVASLQHVLEGYKVAPEIARHGASCSPFSDWWAYKWEAADAIPHCAALLQAAGVSVCLKSDSRELMRHMYQEAAKVIKYGGMTELGALRTITLNGASQLGIERRTGSIEVGKDGDLAIFNGHPLNGYSRCEMTLIEGEVYFQRSKELKPLPAAAAPPVPPMAWKAQGKVTPGKFQICRVTAHIGTGAILKDATISIEGGKITGIRPWREGDEGLDGSGLHAFPGLIDSGSVLGLVEVDSSKETRDHAESGDFQPDLKASTGINPDSELIPVTRANGVLTVVTRPTGGVVAGQSALINLAGWVPSDMVVTDPLALHIELPGGLPGVGRGTPFGRAALGVARKAREAKLRRLRELFRQAATVKPSKPDPRLEALAPYATGKKPVIIEASRREDILEALKLADDLKIKLIISGGLDAWKVADELKKRSVPVLLGPVMSLPTDRYDPYDAPFACAAKLHKAGVKFAIRSTGDSNTRNLPYHAAMAVSYGLPVEEGLRSVTLSPAEILGVGDKLGSLAAGKQANIVLATGDLLQPSAQVVGLFIGGKPIAPESKQSRLFEKYLGRLREAKGSK
jgi:imidazolonepropionase-like amidohydrolase